MKKWLVIIVLVALGAFAWWALSPLLFDKEVQDDLDPELAALLESDNGGEGAAETSSPIGEPTTVVEGPFPIEDTPLHPATGSIRIIRSPEQTLVRFEDYEGTNGPDLFVYLAKDLEATEFIDLGRAKGNVGNINYEVPADVDIDEYPYVMTWCRAFSELFDYARIN